MALQADVIPQSQVSASTKIGSNSAILDTKIDETAACLQPAVAKRLHSINETNAAIIVDYVASLKSEVNLADHYRQDVIITLWVYRITISYQEKVVMM